MSVECIYYLEALGESADVAEAGYRGGESQGFYACPVESCSVFSKATLNSRNIPGSEWIPRVDNTPAHYQKVEITGECIQPVEKSPNK